MSDGLFAMACPRCTAQLVIDAHGNGRCPQCSHRFAPRFGVLVPLDDATRPDVSRPDAVREMAS